MTTSESNDEQTRSFVSLAVGTKVTHYEIVRRIGAGGMGVVYLARDTKLERQIALKFLPAQCSADKKLKARFIREARAAAGLKHPNVVTIHEVSEYEDCPFIAMEYVDGETLRDVVCQGRLSIERSRDILLQLCSGLKEAHESGIVHRDIKPANIIVDRKGRCRILDFGLAKGYDDSKATMPGTIMGTANYMSPEQGQGLEVDLRSDIFSLGVVFYEMLTGTSPFKRATVPATIYAVVHEQPDKIADNLAHDAECWQAIINRMLAKIPADRYQSVDHLIADVERLGTGVSLSEFIVPEESPTYRAVSGLAVLYLRNLGPHEDEYLSYGITEDLIVDLTRLGSIRVAPMRSVLKLKDTDQELAAIANKLNVGLILDGSIHKTASQVRVSSQLIDVSSGKNLWANRWEEPLDRLHLIKTALAEAVSDALAVESSVAKAAQVGEPEAKNPRAYEYYLRGKYTFEHRHSTRDVRVASDLYDQALKLEPSLLAAKEGAAEILVLEGQYEQANQVLLTALVEARRRHQLADEARTLRLLAKGFNAQSMWDEAARYAEEAATASEQIGDLAGEAAALGVMIETLQMRARFEEALKLADRVLMINRQLNDRDKESEALNLIGTVYVRQGDYDRAMTIYKEALEIAVERDQATVQASSIGNIGTAYFYLGDIDEALSYYERSMRMFSDLGDATKEARLAHNMATIYLSRGEYHKAIDLDNTAQTVYRKYGEPARWALAANSIAHVLTILGQYDEAIVKLEKVREEAAGMDYPLAVALAHANMGLAYSCQGKESAAAEELRTAIEIAEKAGLKGVLAVALSYAGELYYLIDRREESYGYFDRAVDLAQEVGDKQTHLMCLAYLATRTAESAEIQSNFSRQREIAEEAEGFGNPRIILVAERLLAETLANLGRSCEERQEGLESLRRLLSYAQNTQVVIEVQRIQSVLRRLADRT